MTSNTWNLPPGLYKKKENEIKKKGKKGVGREGCCVIFVAFYLINIFFIYLTHSYPSFSPVHSPMPLSYPLSIPLHIHSSSGSTKKGTASHGSEQSMAHKVEAGPPPTHTRIEAEQGNPAWGTGKVT